MYVGLLTLRVQFAWVRAVSRLQIEACFEFTDSAEVISSSSFRRLHHPLYFSYRVLRRDDYNLALPLNFNNIITKIVC